MSSHMTVEMGADGKAQQTKFTGRGNSFSLMMDRELLSLIRHSKRGVGGAKSCIAICRWVFDAI